MTAARDERYASCLSVMRSPSLAARRSRWRTTPTFLLETTS